MLYFIKVLLINILIVVLICLFFNFEFFFLNEKSSFDQNVKLEKNDLNKILNKKYENNQTFLDFFQNLDLSSILERNQNKNVKTFTPSHVDQFNNNHLLPRLLSLIEMDYFRYIKLNLNKKCTLWSDDAKCSKKDCTIRSCDESVLPEYLINEDGQNELKMILYDKECNENNNNDRTPLHQIVKTISTEKISTMNDLFECYISEYEDGDFYDLKENPEQFTGYKGYTARRIWSSIYEENCFKSKKFHQLNDLSEKNSAQSFEKMLNLDDLCLEEKLFYRAISGLHTSINIHLSSYYHFTDGRVGSNLKEFLKRFENRYDYLKNLYFLFLLELRALNKIEHYLLTKVSWLSSGDQIETILAIKDILKIISKFKFHFDEVYILKDKEFQSAEFAQHFRNISTTIIDCVACDKCKLWGKVQIHALGTAFKILLTDFSCKIQLSNFHLHRHEISTLFNGITRLSNSINNLNKFNKLLKSSKKTVNKIYSGLPSVTFLK